MENSTLILLTNELFLGQSELFKEEYKSFEPIQIQTFNDLSISNLEEWYNSLFAKYPYLNEIQKKCIQLFFKKLEFVLKNINPDTLNINDDLIEDSDLMLWRESSQGISKLIFDEYGQIVYMYNDNNGTKIKGIFDINVDMEKLLYRFLQK
jgi:hypothetical protein